MELPKNLAAFVKDVGNLVHYLLAGDATDNAAKDTGAIDRQGFLSAVFEVAWKAIAVADTKTLAIGVKFYQSADGSNWDAAEVLQASTVVFTAANPTLSGSGKLRFNKDLSSCKRYVKWEVTADLNAANTDTAAYGCIAMLGGADTLPTT